MNDLEKLRLRKRVCRLADELGAVFTNVELDVHETLQDARKLVEILEPWARVQPADQFHLDLFSEEELIVMTDAERAECERSYLSHVAGDS